MRVQKVCQQCGKEFYTQEYRLKTGRGKYCSRHCLGKTLTSQLKPWPKGGSAWNKGKMMSIATRLKQSEAKKRFIKEHPEYLDVLKKNLAKGRSHLTPEGYRLAAPKIALKNRINTKRYYSYGINRAIQSNRIRKVWEKDEFIAKYIKHLCHLNYGILSGNQLTDKFIQAKILQSKIRRSLNV
jgi:hypothetical protein